MNEYRFYDDLNSGKLAPLYVFEGREELTKREALDSLRALLLPRGLEALNESILENPTARQIIEAAETMPMMCDKRLVVARDWAALMPGQSANEEAEIAAMTKYIANPCDTAVVIIYLRGVGEQRKKIVVEFRAKVDCVVFSALSAADISKRIARQLKPFKKKISTSATRMLISFVGSDLTRLDNEIMKLAAYVGARSEIDERDIEAIVSPTTEAVIFKMIDCLIESNVAEAMRILKSLINAGENRVAIIATIIRQLRGISAMKRGQAAHMSTEEVRRTLKINSTYWAQSMARQAEKMKSIDIEGLYARCVDIDYEIKSGKIRDTPALDMLIMDFARVCAPIKATNASSTTSKYQGKTGRRY